MVKSMQENIIDDIVVNRIVLSKRKSLSITVDAEANVIVRAPDIMPMKTIKEIIQSKKNWIEEKKQNVLKLKEEVPEISYDEGDKVLYRGNQVALKYAYNLRQPIYLENNHIVIEEKHKRIAPHLLKQWYSIEALNYFNRKAAHYAKTLKVHYKKVKISNAEKRWGSCSSKKNINLSWRLIMAPERVIDYVIIHELAHLIELNHSQKFWNIVARIMPSYKKQINWLKKNGHLLNI